MTEPIYQYRDIVDGGQEFSLWYNCDEQTYLALSGMAHCQTRRLYELDAEPLATNDELVALLPGVYYMDPPDGGAPSVLEQLQRMAADAARWRAAVERVAKETASYERMRDAATRSGDQSTRQHATAVLVGLALSGIDHG